jgi:superfamily I DNA/RNA helicase
VGDPNQSIYGWRGASASNLDEFDSDFNETEDEEESGGSDEEREASKRIREMVSFIFL